MDTTLSGGFDTLSAANDLQNAGFNREQAEVLSHTMARAHGDLATKADITVVKADITVVKADVAALRREVDAVRSEVDAVRREVSSLRILLLSVFMPLLVLIVGAVLKPIFLPA
ncbi:MAG: hypothetical protein OXU53_02080 [Deltaproteobacteria bacterium]|nr:hypothetical protein [Deltaproteobacteria bacterium]